MAVLELPSSHRYLAAAILRRAVFDLTTRSRSCREAWDWFFTDPDEQSPAEGWDFEDAARVLELSVPHLRKALIRAGYGQPPEPVIGGQRQKIAGIIPCRSCGVACPAPDVRIQRTCPACGGRLAPKYLRRRGLLTYQNGETCSRVAHAEAALQHVLYQGPLPAQYVQRQLERAGLRPITIRRARERLRLVSRPTGAHRPWVWMLPSAGPVKTCSRVA